MLLCSILSFGSSGIRDRIPLTGCFLLTVSQPSCALKSAQASGSMAPAALLSHRSSHSSLICRVVAGSRRPLVYRVPAAQSAVPHCNYAVHKTLEPVRVAAVSVVLHVFITAPCPARYGTTSHGGSSVWQKCSHPQLCQLARMRCAACAFSNNSSYLCTDAFIAQRVVHSSPHPTTAAATAAPC